MVDVLWKTVTGILNLCLTVSIQFYEGFHVFHTGRGMGTASLKSNMLQHLTDMKEEALYEIFYIFINPMMPWIAKAVL